MSNFQIPPLHLLEPLIDVYKALIQPAIFLQSVDPSLHFTSWYRDRDLNARVGGDPQSQHLLGFALDLTTDRPDEAARLARAQGLTAVVELDHVHLQLFPKGFLRSLGIVF